MTQTQKIFNQEGKKNQSRKKIRLDLVNKFLLCLIIVSGIGFIVTINDLSIKGFVLQDLKMSMKNLQAENQQIELAITKLQSYDNIEIKAQEMKMVKVDKIDYITVNDLAVAKR